jgi:MerR family redox-sensitive transcriptional activator SoxR
MKYASSQEVSAMNEGDVILRIGAFAHRAGVAPSTLRYYERLCLLPPAERRNGRRFYPASALERVAFIRLCHSSGFTLAEIHRLLAGSGIRRAWVALARQKVRELEGRIHDARRAKELLEHALACPSPNLLTCPKFRASVRAHLPAVDR